MDGKQFEPMLIHVSDGVHEGSERPEISLRQLRKNVKMHCAAVEAAQERPFFALSVSREAERELVERVIKVVFEPGSAAMILIVPGNPTYSARKPRVIEHPMPIIPALFFQDHDPREAGPDLYFDEQSIKHAPSCLVHDCEVCKRASAKLLRFPVPDGS